MALREVTWLSILVRITTAFLLAAFLAWNAA